MTDCPICSAPLTFWGDEPSCSPCVIEGRRDALYTALNLARDTPRQVAALIAGA